MHFRDILITAARSGGVWDSDVAAWAAAVVANGGTVSPGRAAIVAQFIGAEKDSGAWALTDDYMGLWAEGSVQALTSLKQRRLATVSGTPTFTTDRDYLFDGSNYIDTGFIPSTHALSMGANSVHVEVYERSNVSTNTAAIGTNSGTNRQVRVNPNNGSNAALGYGNNAQGTFTLPASTSVGLTQMGRSGVAVTTAYGAKNGVDMVRSADPSAVGASLPSHSLYIGGLNNIGSLTNGRACRVGFVAWGAALSEAQRLARYNAVQAWATAVGAQV